MTEPTPLNIINRTWTVRSVLKENNELLGCIVGLITSFIFLGTQLNKIDGLDPIDLLKGIDLLNIFVILCALSAIKCVSLEIDGKEMSKLSTTLALSGKEGESITLRVNEIVRQLVYCVRWFALILGLFYLLQLFTDATITQDEKDIKYTLSGSYNVIELIQSELPFKIHAIRYLVTETFTNAANLFSAAYLFLAFQVLFLVTVDKDNRTWRMKGWIPMSVAMLIMVANILFFLDGDSLNSRTTLANISHMIRLTGGIYNGLAMLLLFSRFISMEYFFQNSSRSWQRNFYFYGTVIGLPLYVLAQPMYGIFNAVEIGESAVLFKSFVFLVCFWGKLVFFLFIFTMLDKKWIHAYLFISLTQRDTVSKVSKSLKEVEDL